MATFVSANVLKLIGTDPQFVPRTDISVSLHVTLYSRSRELRRDGAGGIHVCSDSPATETRRNTSFPATWFDEAEMMRWVLRGVLDQAVDDGSLDVLASHLRAHVDRTYERHLSADIEVVHDTFLGQEETVDNDRFGAHVDLAYECRLIPEIEVVRPRFLGQKKNGAIERLKKNCGFLGHELGTCSVCLEGLSGNLIRAPPCSHHYHEACIVPWLKKNNSCPLCRSKIL